MSSDSYIYPKDPHELLQAWLDGDEIETSFLGRLPNFISGSSQHGDAFVYAPRVLEYRIKVDPYKKFKQALAAGERVDLRHVDHAGTVWWDELAPGFFGWEHHAPEAFRIALPWQDERDAQARGEAVQYRNGRHDMWDDGYWMFDSTAPGAEYRIKPKPHEVVVRVTAEGHTGPARGVHLNMALAGKILDGKIIDLQLKDWTAA